MHRRSRGGLCATQSSSFLALAPVGVGQVGRAIARGKQKLYRKQDIQGTERTSVWPAESCDNASTSASMPKPSCTGRIALGRRDSCVVVTSHLHGIARRHLFEICQRIFLEATMCFSASALLPHFLKRRRPRLFVLLSVIPLHLGAACRCARPVAFSQNWGSPLDGAFVSPLHACTWSRAVR